MYGVRNPHTGKILTFIGLSNMWDLLVPIAWEFLIQLFARCYLDSKTNIDTSKRPALKGRTLSRIECSTICRGYSSLAMVASSDPRINCLYNKKLKIFFRTSCCPLLSSTMKGYMNGSEGSACS